MTRIINAETRIPYLILLIVFIISIYPFFLHDINIIDDSWRSVKSIFISKKIDV